jgi:hypothetical protein
MLTVANFLETQVFKREYDQSTFVKGDYERLTIEHPCGTSACALGYTALLYPEHWHITAYGAPVLVGKQRTPYCGAAKFFGISEEEVLGIFATPENTLHAGTPKSVAKAMRRLVAKYGWEQA